MPTSEEYAQILLVNVKKLLPPQTLKELTNNEGSDATTIDDVVLLEACLEVVGAFNLESGVEPNPDIPAFKTCMRDGVHAVLLSARGVDTAVQRQKELSFYAKCKSIREKSYQSPITSSPYQKTSPQLGTLAPMDESKIAINRNRFGSTIGKSIERNF